MDAMPQACAGLRNEPPMSLPRPMGLMPDARAAPSPPLDPPGVRSASHGLRVRPYRLESVWMRRPMSGMFVRPIGMAPAAFMRATTGASSVAMASAKTAMPFVVA